MTLHLRQTVSYAALAWRGGRRADPRRSEQPRDPVPPKTGWSHRSGSAEWPHSPGGWSNWSMRVESCRPSRDFHAQYVMQVTTQAW